MNILVTGYSGFIGQRLVPRLLTEGHTVLCAGRRPPEGDFASHSRYQACDLVDGSGLADLPWRQVDAVVHLAAAGVKSSHRFWPECLAVNIVGLQHLLTTMGRLAEVQRVVVTGTFYEKLVETNPVLWENPYVATKWTAAQSVQAWAQHFGGSTCLLQLFQAYGPGDSQGNVLSYVKGALQAGRVAKLGSGKSRRDWLHIEDAVAGICTSLQLPTQNRFNVYDVGSGELHSIREAAEQLADVMNKPRDLLDFDWKRDRHDLGIELAATQKIPGWAPRYSFGAGLQAFAQA
jgi:nucleoside-diphosphate-sugar epimerase